MANRINKIISTKANTLYAMKNLIKKAESLCEAPLRRKTV